MKFADFEQDSFELSRDRAPFRVAPQSLGVDSNSLKPLADGVSGQKTTAGVAFGIGAVVTRQSNFHHGRSSGCLVGFNGSTKP